MDFFRRIFNEPDENSPQSGEESTGVLQNQTPATESVVKQSETVTDELIDADNEEDYETGEIFVDDADDTAIPPYIDSQDTSAEEGDPHADATNPMGITRPLPQEPVFATQTGHLIFGQKSDVGMQRSNNQDSAMSIFFTSDTVDERPDFGIFIVADGMGGHSEGEKASAITAKTIMEHVLTSVYVPMLRGNGMDADMPPILEALEDGIKKANDDVREQVRDGGTTVTAVVILGDQAYIGHVGDSRGYYLTDSHGLEQLTRDHSVVKRLIELGQLTEEEAETHDQRNVLYRAIGQNEEVDVDLLRRRLPPASQLLLCSDGLWGMMKNEDIRRIMEEALSPEDACEKLIALANKNGGTDNITGIIIKMPGK